jgi:hypothetical protein
LRENKSYHKWTDEEVLAIRALKKTCKMTTLRIALHTGRSITQINHALYRYKLQPPKLGFFAKAKRFISYLFS